MKYQYSRPEMPLVFQASDRDNKDSIRTALPAHAESGVNNVFGFPDGYFGVVVDANLTQLN